MHFCMLIIFGCDVIAQKATQNEKNACRWFSAFQTVLTTPCKCESSQGALLGTANEGIITECIDHRTGRYLG